MASVRRSLVLSFAQKYSTVVVQIVSTMILARLLTPAEIGIFSVGLAIVGMVHVLRGFGVANYLIQERELTPDRIRTAFGVALVIAWTMAGLLFLLSGPMSVFYGEPGVRLVMMVLSINFVLIPFNSPVLALLRREMNFGALFRINVASAFAGAATSVSLAALGFGFISLAWGSVAGVLTTVVVAAVLRPGIARVLPGFREWRRVVSFGGKMSVAAIIGELGTIAPELAIGRLLGFSAVGIYSRAAGVATLFNKTIMDAIGPVAMPALAVRHRAGGDMLAAYLRAMTYVTGLAWPFFAFLAFMAYPLVRIMFGDQWDAAVPLIQIMCVYRSVMGLYSFVPQIMISTARIDNLLKLQMVFQPINIVIVVVAAFHSLEAVAGAGILITILYFALSYFHLRGLIGLSLAGMLHAVRASAGVMACSTIGPAFVFTVMDIGPDRLWTPFLVASATWAAGWFCGLLVFKHPLREEVSIVWQHLRVMQKRWRGRVA